MPKKKLLIFASGDKAGGGSGFQELVESCKTGILNADIIGVVSNHNSGGVWHRSFTLNIPFHHMPKPYSAEAYQEIAAKFGADFFSLSGWLKPVMGLPPEKTFNIHPGPLPQFGGQGMYGHHVHESVMVAYRNNEIGESAVTMHFVTEEYDKGPIFFRYPVLIRTSDTPETLAARVNKIEHGWQPFITNLVISGEISLEKSGTKYRVIVPAWYPFLPKN